MTGNEGWYERFVFCTGSTVSMIGNEGWYERFVFGTGSTESV